MGRNRLSQRGCFGEREYAWVRVCAGWVIRHCRAGSGRLTQAGRLDRARDASAGGDKQTTGTEQTTGDEQKISDLIGNRSVGQMAFSCSTVAATVLFGPLNGCV